MTALCRLPVELLERLADTRMINTLSALLRSAWLMSLWLATGAHLNWADYSPLSRLTGLTDLQLAHCSGALPMHWLAAAPGLVRLYIKGNGAAAGQTVALAGGAAALSLLDNLEDLYLGLCEFTEADGVLPGRVVCRPVVALATAWFAPGVRLGPLCAGRRRGYTPASATAPAEFAAVLMSGN